MPPSQYVSKQIFLRLGSPRLQPTDRTTALLTCFQHNHRILPTRRYTTTSQPPKRPVHPWVWATSFLFLGSLVGTILRENFAPPSLAEIGSKRDIRLTTRIHADAKKLPIVKQLNGDPAWKSWDAYSNETSQQQDTNKKGEQRPPRMTAGVLSGSSGLPYQRIWWKEETGEMMSVVYFGKGLFGWPGVVHGGALATILDESLGRCAVIRFPSKTGVTAKLDVAYRSPVSTGDFYIIKARPVPGIEAEALIGKDGTRKMNRKLWVEAQLESLKGKLCVEAKALFVTPKNIDLKPIGVGF